MTISASLKLTSTDVSLDMPSVSVLAGKLPAFRIVKSGLNVLSCSAVGRMSMLCIKSAWYGRAQTMRMFSRTEPNLMALKISGSPSGDRSMALA